MPAVRRLEVSNFRGIESLDWFPRPGVNCLIGPGDGGKSTVLEAIGLALSPGRSQPFSDTDFHRLDVARRIRIAVTLGALDDDWLNVDVYGSYLRGYDATRREILPEPARNAEEVLTVVLDVGPDLEPCWQLWSERTADEPPRFLRATERHALAPTWLTASGDYHLAWRRGSILHRLTEQRVDATALLAQLARDARTAVTAPLTAQVTAAITAVTDTAQRLGVPLTEVKATLDAASVSFGGGTIALHDGRGVPLRDLGLGSTRLLIAGLQRHAARAGTIVLVDEVEHGLEPHRLIRFLTELGSKDEVPRDQCFVTTHSPVAVRELSIKQLNILRRHEGHHEVRHADDAQPAAQGTLRACPEAFLATRVVVCEGATEIGLMRGIDFYRSATGETPLATLGVCLSDGHGDSALSRAMVFQALGYPTLLLRDTDKPVRPRDRERFLGAGGRIAEWPGEQAVENALFDAVPDDALAPLLDAAVANKGERLVDEHLRSASNGTWTLARARGATGDDVRRTLGFAAKYGDWYKTVGAMESAAHGIVAPALPRCAASFQAVVERVIRWAHGAELLS